MRTILRRPSLRTQLVAAFVLVTVLATVLVALSAIWLRRQALVDQATDAAVDALREDLLVAGEHVNARAEFVAVESPNTTRRVLSDDDLGALGDAIASSEDGLLLQQPSDTGRYSSRPDLVADAVPESLRQVVAQGMIGEARQRRDGRPELVVGGRVASDALAVYRFVDLGDVDAELAAMGRTLAVAGVVPVGSALLVGFVAAGRLLRPVRRARDAAGDLRDGDLGTRLPVRGNDELADLSRSFNEMAASLQTTVDELRTMEAQQRRFVADVSHELRTPLTTLVAAVEVLEDELGTTPGDGALDVPEDRRHATLLAIEEVRAMRGLVEDLMEITRFDAGRAQLDETPVDIAEAVADTLRWRDHTDEVTVTAPPALRARVDRRRLDTIVANLVGNALTHGAAPVEVRAAAVGDDLVVEVVDAGGGLPAGVRDRLFERFAKGDQARTRSGGSGLGLAIARENARLHGGEVELAATGPTGTTMRCTLPGRVLPPEEAPASPTPTEVPS